MLIYLYMVKRKKKKVVARTLAPGSRGEKKAHTVLDFFFLIHKIMLRAFVELI